MFGNEHNMFESSVYKSSAQRAVRADSMTAHTSLLLVLVLMPVVWAQPYPIPPTCYTKVLNMGKEITQMAAEIKKDHDTVSLTD